MEREFNTSNPKRCRFAELPYCACANKDEPPAAFAPPPPYQYVEDFESLRAFKEGEPTLGGADQVWNPDLAQASALVKRLENAKTLQLSLRSSHRTVPCPGADDGMQTCARFCAAEELTELRAFTVTGTIAVPPPLPPPSAPVDDVPPLPPSLPFSECLNECPLLAAGDTKCRDGGKVNCSSFESPTHNC